MNLQIKEQIINTYIELFTRGEMLKGWRFINACVPQELEDDEDIALLRAEANTRIQEIRDWPINGREYPGTHATVEFNSFPKFVLAKEKILSKYRSKKILDIGCYSGVFLEGMKTAGFDCWGIDIHGELMDKLNKDSDERGPFYKFGSADNIPIEDGECDIVTAFDVLEHILEIEKALKEIDRVCKKGGFVIINVPRMTYGYKDEAYEHVRMFSDKDIERAWGKKKDFKLEMCSDEHGRPTSFITYING